jgi:PAS domain S-box-containing protein
LPKKVKKRGIRSSKSSSISDISKINSDSLINAIFKNSDDCVAYVTLDLTIQKLSQGFKKLSGYDADKFIGKKVFSLPVFDTKALATIALHVRECIKNKKTQNYDVSFKPKNKDKGIVNITSDVIIEEGKVKGFVAFVRDKTQENIHKKEIEEANFLLNKAQELGKTGSWTFDLKTQTPKWSLQMFKIFGVNPKDGEPIYNEHKKYFHPDDWDYFNKEVAHSLKTGKGYNIEVRLLQNKNPNKIIWINSISENVYENGKLVGLRGVTRNITDEKKANAELKNKEHKFRSIFENSPDAIVLIDMKGNLLDTNNRFEEWLGYKKEDVLGKNLAVWPHLPLKSKTIALDIFRRRMGGENIPPYELEFRHKNGNPVIGEITGTFIKDVDGKLWADLVILRNITEAKKAKAQIKDSENILSNIIESVADPLFVKDSNHKWIHMNTSFANFIGTKKEKLLGKSDYDFFPKHQADAFWKKDNAVFNSNEPITNEEKLTDRNGKEHFILTSKSSFTLPSKEKILVGTFKDITDIKKVEKQIEAERDIAQKYLDVAKVIIIVLDRKGNVSLINKTGVDILGYKKSSIVGKNWFEKFLVSDDLKAVKKVFSEMLQGNIIEHFENHIKTKTGKKFISWNNSYLKDENGDIIGILSSGQDITNMRHEQLEQSRISTALKQAHDTIVITDINGNIQYANPAFERSSGYKVKEALGKNPRVLKSGKQDKKFYEDMWNTISSGKVWNGEFVNKKKNKELYIESASITPIMNENGDITNYVAIKNDITLQKKAEEEVKKRIQELETFQDVAVDRELRMEELENKIVQLKKQIDFYQTKNSKNNSKDKKSK